MQRLFTLMRHKDLIDSALGLLLSAGDDLLPLSTVEDLPLIVETLTPRGLGENHNAASAQPCC